MYIASGGAWDGLRGRSGRHDHAKRRHIPALKVKSRRRWLSFDGRGSMTEPGQRNLTPRPPSACPCEPQSGRVNLLSAFSRARARGGHSAPAEQSEPPMPRRATRAANPSKLMDSISSDGLDIDAGGGVVVVARELWGQPDNTSHRNGTDDGAQSSSLFIPFRSRTTSAAPTRTRGRRRWRC
jgi:hypothetical protein